jgi:ADP-heptose:LPS heptosyltransferase
MVRGVSAKGQNLPPNLGRPPMSGGFLLVAAPLEWRDACFSVPAVRAIRHARPQATLGVLCCEEQVPLWESVTVDKVLAYPARSKPRAIAEVLREDEHRWDTVVLWEAGSVAEACQRAGVAERCGRPVKGLARRLTRELEVVEGVGPVEHRVRHFLEIVQALGVEAYLPRNFETSSLAVARDGRAVVVAPGSDFGPSHEWELEGWIETARAALRFGVRRITVAAVAGGTGLARSVFERLGAEGAQWQEFVSPGEALPVLAAHGLFVGADGSLAHLAAHAGTRCVTLFGPDDPAWRRPLGRHNLVVRRHVECAPCLLGKCPLDRRCQRELTAHEVIDAIRRQVAGAGAG